MEVLFRFLQVALVAIHWTADASSDDRFADTPKEVGGQIAIADRRLAPRNRPDIIAGPREAVPLGDDDPRLLARQAKITPNCFWHFDRQMIAGRGFRGQRYDVHLIDPVLRTGHQHDGDRPVLYTFIATVNVLVFPQVAVVENFTRLRQR
jgi:hypothetical protein